MTNVIEYVTEEVRRQGHDVHSLDGIERVGWMLDGWSFALDAERTLLPDVYHAVRLGQLVEKIKNVGGLRRCGVRVGDRVCPPAQEVHAMLNSLFLRREDLKPMQFYKEFELIHPFVDGNGRTGKILLNWLNGTLLNPIFPPNDLFGEPILNP